MGDFKGDGHGPAVVFVCLGNICRSPTAEGVMRAKAPGWRIESAGTGAWHVGEPPDRRMQAAARGAGYDLSDLRARQFGAGDFERFDLIVVMDRANQRDVETLRPAGNDTPVRLLLSYAETGRDEVPDPYYEGGFDAVVEMIAQACDGIVAAQG